MSLKLSAPIALAATHTLNDFACGQASLDEWLKRRALINQLSGASRTFVVTDQAGRVFAQHAPDLHVLGRGRDAAEPKVAWWPYVVCTGSTAFAFTPVAGWKIRPGLRA
jgi:hypothetical protein